MPVVQIAASVAGGKEFFARTGVALQHCDAGCRVGLGGSQRSGKPCRSAAQNEDLCHGGTCLSCGWISLPLL